MASDWLIALSGGAAGAVLTQLAQGFRNSWTKPKLEIIFSKRTRGCRVDTNVVGGFENIQCYLRLKILNRGRTTAQNVSVSVVSLKFRQSDGKRIRFDEEVMDVKLALRGELQFRLVGKHAYRYVDLAHTLRVTGNQWGYVIDVNPAPARLAVLGFGPGAYWAQVVASADNARTVRCTVGWTFAAEHSGLQIVEWPRWEALRCAVMDFGSSIARRFRRAAIDQSEREER
jgi:hypothetical protein